MSPIVSSLATPSKSPSTLSPTIFDRLHAQLVVRGAAVEVAEERHAAFPLERPHDERDRCRRVVDRGLKVDAADAVGVVGHLAGRTAGARRAQRAEVHAFRIQGDRPGATVPAHVVYQPRLIVGEAVGHLFRQPLDGAGCEDVRRISLDELADLARAERIAVDVERRAAAAVLEGLFMTFETAARIRARDADGRVVEPFVGTLQVGSRHARVALASADVRAAAVERVERRGKELVADFEGFRELLARAQRIQVGLLDVLGHRAVDVRDVGEVGDDRPRRHAGEENADGEKERTKESHTRHPFSRRRASPRARLSRRDGCGTSASRRRVGCR